MSASTPAPPVGTQPAPNLSLDLEAAKSPPATDPSLPPTKRPLHHRLLPRFPDAPPFRLWLRRSWLDILTQLLCVLTAYLIYMFGRPLMPRLLPLFPGIERTPWGIKHGQPYMAEYVTTVVSAVVSFLGPFAVMGGVGLWMSARESRRGNAKGGDSWGFWDSNAAVRPFPCLALPPIWSSPPAANEKHNQTIGLGYALATATLFQALIKLTIGGLRPHFLALCNPHIPPHYRGAGPASL